ncbi:MAG: two-component system sensor histidine kinase NarX [Gammaproteobacteria bacterium]
MSTKPSEKLLMRLGVAMGTITALAFIGMVSSVFIAEAMEGTASAINQAGTLRMQSYRIASHLGHADNFRPDTTTMLIREFDRRLISSRLTTILSRDPAHVERRAYNGLVTRWRREIRPVLNAYAVLLRSPLEETRHRHHRTLSLEARESLRSRFLSTVDDYVDDIDRFVFLLERKTESKISILRLIQMVSLFLTLIVVVVTMYMMHTRVLLPLRELLMFARQARRGDFDVRVRHTSDDELGQLGAAFNLMAEDLSRIYNDLERRVQEKTEDLEISNRSLELLYNTVSRLGLDPMSKATYRELLVDLDALLGIGPSTICLASEDGQDTYPYATSWSERSEVPSLCEMTDCAACTSQHREHRRLQVHDHSGFSYATHAVPVRDQDHRYGLLLTHLPEGGDLLPWQTRLLEAVAAHVATAITLARRAEQGRRVALLEERNVIARELHDSLAQSLSYMKIQVGRLQTALAKENQAGQPERILCELREGISNAYRQLRELLNTFRLSMDGSRLSDAVRQTVEEFRERDRKSIELSLDLRDCRLSPHEEIHTLQVVREALTNAVRHAQATRIRVDLHFRQASRCLSAIVEDNGIGMRDFSSKPDHYGLAIMEERVNSLGGRFVIGQADSGGTRVELHFTPRSEITEDLNKPERKAQ